jgi:hypothetical protein
MKKRRRRKENVKSEGQIKNNRSGRRTRWMHCYTGRFQPSYET